MKKFLVLFVVAFFLSAGVAMAAVNVNTATEAQLEQLPGIGQTKAAAIIVYRKAHGDFHSLSELSKVEGIGEATVDKLKGKATVSDGK